MCKNKYSSMDDFTIIYQQDNIRLVQNETSPIIQKYQGKCSECGCWYDIDFEKTLNNIKGYRVGDPLKPTIVESAHNMKVTLAECIGCGYVHVFKYEDYSEIKDFGIYSMTGKCTYVNHANILCDIEYKLVDAETIAKFIIGYCSVSAPLMKYSNTYLGFISAMITKNQYISKTLVTIMILDIIAKREENKLDYDIMKNWYIDGRSKLKAEEVEKWEALTDSVFL